MMNVSELVPMSIKGLMLDPVSNSPIVVLKDDDEAELEAQRAQAVEQAASRRARRCSGRSRRRWACSREARLLTITISFSTALPRRVTVFSRKCSFLEGSRK